MLNDDDHHRNKNDTIFFCDGVRIQTKIIIAMAYIGCGGYTAIRRTTAFAAMQRIEKNS